MVATILMAVNPREKKWTQAVTILSKVQADRETSWSKKL
jgi:hypothetical protein